MNQKIKNKILKLILSFIIILAGLILLKYIPMTIYGNILFDASLHIALSFFGLYAIWVLFIKNKKKLKIPYFIFSAVILSIIGIQRITSYNHNIIGVLLGLIIGVLAIVIPGKE